MKRKILAAALLAGTALAGLSPAFAGQAPYGASAPNIPVSNHDRVYAAEQFSNTVSVIDPSDNKLLGVIRAWRSAAGELQPALQGPGAGAWHGLLAGSPHPRASSRSAPTRSPSSTPRPTRSSTSPMSARSPHEAFFTPDGKEVWVTVRGENYVDVLDGKTFEEKTRIMTPPRARHDDFLARRQIRLRLLVVQPGDRRGLASPTTRSSRTVTQASPFCPNIAATPDGKQVWFTLKDTGKTASLQRAAALQYAEDARHRPDHQSRQYRAQRATARSPMSRSAA